MAHYQKQEMSSEKCYGHLSGHLHSSQHCSVVENTRTPWPSWKKRQPNSDHGGRWGEAWGACDSQHHQRQALGKHAPSHSTRKEEAEGAERNKQIYSTNCPQSLGKGSFIKNLGNFQMGVKPPPPSVPTPFSWKYPDFFVMGAGPGATRGNPTSIFPTTKQSWSCVSSCELVTTPNYVWTNNWMIPLK